MDGPLWLDKTKAGKVVGRSRQTITRWVSLGYIKASPKRPGVVQLVYMPSLYEFLGGRT